MTEMLDKVDEPETDNARFEVAGMTCASCALRIERTLSKQAGVTEASVNLAGAEAKVVFDRKLVEPSALEAAVRKIGYELTEVASEEERTSAQERFAEEARVQLRNVIGAGALTLPLAVLAMGGIDTSWSRVVQWVLATPVLFVFGWQFHRTAVLRARSFDQTWTHWFRWGRWLPTCSRSGRSSSVITYISRRRQSSSPSS